MVREPGILIVFAMKGALEAQFSRARTLSSDRRFPLSPILLEGGDGRILEPAFRGVTLSVSTYPMAPAPPTKRERRTEGEIAQRERNRDARGVEERERVCSSISYSTFLPQCEDGPALRRSASSTLVGCTDRQERISRQRIL